MDQKIKHPYLVISGMLLGAFVGMFSETSLNIALPTLVKSFSTTTSTVQWLVTGYMLVIGIILPLSSIISKWFTTRQIISFALIDFMVGAIISALAPNFPALLAGRMIQGIGTGLILPLMFAVTMQVFPPQKIGTAIGVNGLVIMFAPAIGPTLTGFILGKLSWNWIFWLFVPFLAIALLFTLRFLVNIEKVTRPRVDKLSIFESAVGCSCIVVGVSFASTFGWLSWQVLAFLIVGIIILAAYAVRQIKLPVPILKLQTLKDKNFAICVLIVMLDFGMMLSAMYLLPMYIQNSLLLPVALTGIVMLPGGVVNAITSAIAGRIYDYAGFKKPAVFGFIIALIGAVMLAFSTVHTSIAYIITANVILMIGGPLAMSPVQSGALNSLSAADSGDGSTILNTVQQIFGAVCTAIATSLLGMGQRSVSGSAPVKFVTGFHYGLGFTITVIIVGIMLVTLTKEQRTSKGVDLN
ncbi:MAG: DHA2 family efflux MFS transporter permease subunit [Limosilactobacillus sp.]|jgi:DHA2 family lincomycin resistance protein-like MFS transporter|uniref:DHA2 family efflux MFS transporter permease subunit n=1 Tax=Limosilactobacillus sp. TaxID=2773925 RepID=UPI0025C208AD|nr:DHA2 family efflux MFS transporter permease subunit [Limosilactobacillus sp.]MCI1974903.1 DHA2 family efflux MFS transporter permease subunit [Limosilactobacillus sp.]MCI2030816.1 DHA2 family efflux MFS transporter permease subunit [Limosilactobacillus sp.]